jgi:hypothetical protein
MDKRKMVLAFLVTSLSWLSTVDCRAQSVAKTAIQPQKKQQNVKVVIRKDGQLIEKDTTIVTSDSKNYTITTKEMTLAADSLYHSLGDDTNGKTVTVTVIQDNENGGTGSKAGTNTYTYTIGDSLQKNGSQKMVRKINGKPMIIMEGGEGQTFDLPVRASSGTTRIVMHKMVDPYAFDPRDPTIVSYKKKDVGKGEEKITIVRKKAEK